VRREGGREEGREGGREGGVVCVVDCSGFEGGRKGGKDGNDRRSKMYARPEAVVRKSTERCMRTRGKISRD